MIVKLTMSKKSKILWSLFMDSWHKDYLLNKEEYLKLFDTTMQKEQETNVEFLEKSLTKLTGRNLSLIHI